MALCGLKTKLQELVSEETRVKYDRVTEQILLMQRIMSSMLQVAHNIENRSLALSQDMKTLASNMRYRILAAELCSGCSCCMQHTGHG